MKIHFLTKIGNKRHMKFHGSFVIMAPNWKEATCPSMGEWHKRQRCFRSREYGLWGEATNGACGSMDETLGVILNEQSQFRGLCVVWFHLHGILKMTELGNEEQIGGCQGLVTEVGVVVAVEDGDSMVLCLVSTQMMKQNRAIPSPTPFNKHMHEMLMKSDWVGLWGLPIFGFWHYSLVAQDIIIVGGSDMEDFSVHYFIFGTSSETMILSE